MAKIRVSKGAATKLARAVTDTLETGKKMRPKAPHAKPSPKPHPKPEAPDPKSPHPKHPDRNRDGTFRGGDAPNPGKIAEQRRLDEIESQLGQPVERRQVLSGVEGTKHGRYYDGLVLEPDGTYTGIEVKSGDAKLTKQQREFDSLVSPDNPAHATLDGKPIVITQVVLSDGA